jgi:hypothetical protein
LNKNVISTKSDIPGKCKYDTYIDYSMKWLGYQKVISLGTQVGIKILD